MIPKTKFLDQHSLIIDYKFGSLVKSKYKIMNLINVYNEESNLPAYFASALRFVDGLIILDDGSNDMTWDQMEAYDYTLKVKIRRHGTKFKELRVRNLLLKILQEVFLDQKIRVDWILWLDCDEIISNTDRELFKLKRQLKSETNEVLTLSLVHMWNETHYNADYPYSQNGQRKYLRLFKNIKKQQPFELKPEKQLHFPLIPYQSKHQGHLSLKIKHYGMSTFEKRHQKYFNYTQIYDKDRIQKSYEHIINEQPRLLLA